MFIEMTDSIWNGCPLYNQLISNVQALLTSTFKSLGHINILNLQLLKADIIRTFHMQ